MSLSPGEKLGPYELGAPVGKGGMGEVWKAHDPRLNRDVAIKVSDAQFTERFTREARAIAALNHTNICHLYDVGPNYLVMEYVEGPDVHGPLDFDEALPIIEQLIDGIEAAHEKNIVHRDLKPANIKITPEGVVKILDFGLAKAVEPAAPSGASPENSPTLTIGATQAGAILGTAAYMAPEQAKGKQADKRSDIWSFGVIVYEVLTGKKLFQGETAVEILGGVLNKDPDVSAAPAHVHELLRWCLEKDRKQRLSSISDARRLLNRDHAELAVQSTTFRPAPLHRSWLPWCIAAFLLLALMPANYIHFRETPPERQHIRFQIAPPEGDLRDFKLSPDGRFLAFAANDGGALKLWIRALDSLEMGPPRSYPAGSPRLFWSADAENVGFSASGKIYKIARTGGPSVAICDLPELPFKGAAWRSDGTILFASGVGLYRVSSSGGTPSKVNDGNIEAPVWLTAERFLFWTPNGIFAGSLTGAKPSLLLPDASGAVVVPRAKSGLPDNLLFLRGENLMAQPIDSEKAELRGRAVPVAERVGNLGPQRIPAFSVSATGVLIFGRGMSADRELVWVDRTGKKLQTVSRPFSQATNPAVRISPDDSRAIVPVMGATGTDLWIADLNRNTLSRFTFDGSYSGIWSPDGRKVLWAANDGNRYLRSADGSGKDELVFKNPTCSNCYLGSWSSDGKRITFSERTDKTQLDIWLVGTDGDRKPYPYLQSRFNETWNAISPDGHWMAYESDQPGQNEILVESIPPGKGRWQISTEGGDWPVWRRDGKELFFRQGTKIMAAPILLTETSVESGKLQPLFEIPATTRFQVSRDGQRFLIAVPVEGAAAAAPLTVDTDWRAAVSQ
jgi:eukaryotic-like serine/threonine-protein kinase